MLQSGSARSDRSGVVPQSGSVRGNDSRAVLQGLPQSGLVRGNYSRAMLQGRAAECGSVKGTYSGSVPQGCDAEWPCERQLFAKKVKQKE